MQLIGLDQDVRSGGTVLKQREVWWKDNFRVTQQTFEEICREVQPYIVKKNTYLRQRISVDERVAVTLWRLATNVDYRTISALFGIGCSTVCTIVIKTCEVLSEHLFHKYVYIPTGEGLQKVVDGFQSQWGFPEAIGAIDGNHIPIIKPCHCPSHYYNRKGFYSIIVEGLVDHTGKFLDAYIGWPGKCHDARVFQNSSLYKKGIEGSLLPCLTRKLGSVDVPLVILGDAAYPLLPWLMKPYIETPSSPDDIKLYNYQQSRAHMVVENSFGKLKGRWRILLKRLDCHLDNVPSIVSACITLHNMCEKFNDHCSPDWVCQSPTQPVSQPSNTQQLPSSSAAIIRDAIKLYFQHN